MKFMFNSKGDVIDLMAWSYDFAYRIHTDIGIINKQQKLMENGYWDYKLVNGDIIEIITSNSSNGPNETFEYCKASSKKQHTAMV